MDEAILQAIKDIEARKEANHLAPTHALRGDLIKEMNAALNRLFAAGKITTGETAKDKWIHATDQ